MTGRLEGNLASLHRLATNRFLWAPVLNELQYSVIDGIRFTQIDLEQRYQHIDGIPAREDIQQEAVPAKAIENILFRVQAEDRGEKFNDFIDVLAKRFEGKLKKREGVSLESRSDPVVSPDGSDSYRAIMIECKYPETTREP